MVAIAAPSVPNPANAPSRRFFASMGIEAGMRVLDVGCGNGDLSRLVANLAGPSGNVVAIDHSDAALAMALAVPPRPDAAQIQYRSADLSAELLDLGRFDVIVGRRVLMYLRDPAKTLAGLVALANPGAIVAFQEHARTSLPAGLGELPLHRRLYDWVWDTVIAEGGDVGLGLRLVELMRSAGVVIQTGRSEAITIQPGEPSFLPTLMQAMLPRLVGHHVASAVDIGIDTLAQRIDVERLSVGGAIVWDLAFLVSGRIAHD